MKIGILAGTFDPVHVGHLAFAKQALDKFSLDKVVFLPERQPRRKKVVTKFSNRLKMLELTITGNSGLEIYDTQEPHFTLAKSLPKLRSKYPDSELVFLVGSDVAENLHRWQGIDKYAEQLEFLVAKRSPSAKKLDMTDLNIQYSKSPQPKISGAAIRSGEIKTGISKVDAYIAEHKLYV